MPLEDSNALFVGFLSVSYCCSIWSHTHTLYTIENYVNEARTAHGHLRYCTNNIYDCMAPHNILRRFSRHEHAHDRSTSIYEYMHVKNIYRYLHIFSIYVYVPVRLYIFLLYIYWSELQKKWSQLFILHLEYWSVSLYLSIFEHLFYYCCCCLPRQCRTWPAKRERRKKTNQEKKICMCRRTCCTTFHIHLIFCFCANK